MRSPVSAALAMAAMVYAGAQALPTLATLSGSSVTITGGSAELDAQGRLRVPDGAKLELAGSEAELSLVRGGTIHLCGPARMSLAGGGEAAMLISLSQGALRLRYASPVADALLTPDFRLATVVPPDQLATVSAAIGVKPDGALCVMNQGSALQLERLADGTQQYIINGQTIEFAPGGGSTEVKSCPCGVAAPAALPAPASGNATANQAGALFPQQPALRVAAGSAVALGTPTLPVNSAVQPPSRHKRNPLARLWHWMFGG